MFTGKGFLCTWPTLQHSAPFTVELASIVRFNAKKLLIARLLGTLGGVGSIRRDTYVGLCLYKED